MIRLRLLAFLITLLPSIAQAAIFYVATTGSDGNPGTQAQPFRTLTKANQQTLSPGSVVHVAAGTYSDAITTTQSGTAGSPITWISDTKCGAKIIPPAVSSSDTAIWAKADYVIVDGFEVDGTLYNSGTEWTGGVYGTGVDVIIRNNCVHHIHLYEACLNHGASGIGSNAYYNANARVHMIGNIIHDIGQLDNSCGYFDQAIYPATGGTIANNLVYSTPHSGLGMQCSHDCRNAIIVNNTFANIGGQASCILLYSAAGESSPLINNDTVDNNTIRNNLCYNSGYNGIECQRGSGGSFGANNVVAFNQAVGNPNSNYDLSQCSVTHTNDVTGTPVFVNAAGNDYRLASGSPGIDQATSTGAQLRDLNGTPRPLGSGFDVGAYEFIPSNTVVVSFPFTSDQQSFTTVPGSNVAMTWQQPGVLQSALTIKNNANRVSAWSRTLGYTTLGVPPGSTVTGIVAGSMDSQATTYAAPGSTHQAGAVTLTDGASVATLSAARSFTAVDGVPVTTAGTNLTGLSKPSTNSVTISISNTLSTANTTGATMTVQQDSLNFAITYTAGTAPSPLGPGGAFFPGRL